MSIQNPYLHSKHPQNILHRKLKTWATVASMSVASILIFLKFVSYMRTDSVSILSSLMDSTFDWVASLATMIGVAHAATPADEEHRFGHGKIEALTALGQAIFIFGSTVYLMFESMHRFMHPVKIKDIDIGLYMMLISIALTACLIAFQYFVIKRTSSIAIAADHLHYKGDLLMNTGVITALILSYYSPWPYFDPLFAVAISVALLFGAVSITRESIDVLMDREIPEADRQRIIDIVNDHPDVKVVHDLRTRSTGTHVFIELHIEMDGDLSLKRAHSVTEDIEKRLYESFPTADVMIHPEPFGMHHHRRDDAF